MSQKGLDILLSSQKLVPRGNKIEFCNDCLYGKQVKSFYNTSSSKKTTPLELMHYDLSTMPTKSLEGSLYSLMITLECVGQIYYMIILKCLLFSETSMPLSLLKHV